MSEINEILTLDSDNQCYEKENLSENIKEGLSEHKPDNLNDDRGNEQLNYKLTAIFLYYLDNLTTCKTIQDSNHIENNEKQYLEFEKHLEECISNKSKLEQENHQLNEKCRDLESRLGTVSSSILL